MGALVSFEIPSDLAGVLELADSPDIVLSNEGATEYIESLGKTFIKQMQQVRLNLFENKYGINDIEFKREPIEVPIFYYNFNYAMLNMKL